MSSEAYVFSEENRSPRKHGDGKVHPVSFPFLPQFGSKIRVRTQAGKRVERTTKTPTYNYQLEAFRDWINGGPKMPTDAVDAVLNMQVIDAIYRSAGLPVRGDHAADHADQARSS